MPNWRVQGSSCAISRTLPSSATAIIGNLVDDPELRFANNGIAVANMRVAVSQRDGEWRDGDTSFFKVMVTGRLHQRSWEAPEGEKRSVTCGAARPST